MAITEIAGHHRFLRFAVAEHPERRGQYGIILVDDRNGVSPVGRDDFPSESAAISRLQAVFAELIGKRSA